jgi:hypothetical protein
VTLSETATVRDAAEILARGEFHSVLVVHRKETTGMSNPEKTGKRRESPEMGARLDFGGPAEV